MNENNMDELKSDRANPAETNKTTNRKFVLFGYLGCGGLLIILLVIALLIFFLGFMGDDDTNNGNNYDNNEEIDNNDSNSDNNDEEEMKVDLNVEIEVTETLIDDESVTVKGTTNLVDGVFLMYQIRATEGVTEVKDGKWEATETIDKIDKDDENKVYGDGDEYNFYITFPTPGAVENQSEEAIELYGGAGGTKITGGPNFYESEDGTLKYVSLEVDFNRDGIIDLDAREESHLDQAVKDWEDHYKEEMLKNYKDARVIDIQENPGSNWDVVYVFVPNDFKLSSEDDRREYVERLGPMLEKELTSYFKKEYDVHVYFLYEDGSTMASRKMLGGWEIR